MKLIKMKLLKFKNKSRMKMKILIHKENNLKIIQ